MCERSPATNGDAGTAKLMTHRRRRKAQLNADLAQCPALGVQVGCTLNVHGATVTSLSRIDSALIHPSAGTIASFTQSHMSFPSSAMSLVGTETMATTSWCSGTTAMS
jgi:hypothetical protein